jgi:hypothetical protein
VKGLVNEVLAPVFAAANGCVMGWSAIDLAQRYTLLLGLCGVQTEWPGRALALVSGVSTSCMMDRFVECRDGHIIHKIVPARVVEQRHRASLGLPSPDPDSAGLDAFVKGCLKFTLDVDSSAQYHSSQGDQETLLEAMRARGIALTLQGSQSDWALGRTVIYGSGPFQMTQYTYTSTYACNKATAPILMPATFEVHGLALVSSPPPAGNLADLALAYATTGGDDSVTWMDTCLNNSGSLNANRQTIDQEIMRQTNPYDFGANGYVLKNWTLSAATDLGRRVVQADVVGVSEYTGLALHKDELFVLHHVPGL